MFEAIAVTTLMLALTSTCMLVDAAEARSDPESSNFTVISGTADTLTAALAKSDLEKLKIAAKTGESHTVSIRDNASSKLIFAQERVALSLDCLPWLQQVKRTEDGDFKIQWFYQQLTEAGTPASNQIRLIPTPEDRLDFQRIIVGGDLNRWLNITQTVAVPGAENPDNKKFTCRIFTASDKSGLYFNSTVDLRMVGESPVIIRGNGSSKQSM